MNDLRNEFQAPKKEDYPKMVKFLKRSLKQEISGLQVEEIEEGNGLVSFKLYAGDSVIGFKINYGYVEFKEISYPLDITGLQELVKAVKKYCGGAVDEGSSGHS